MATIAARAPARPRAIGRPPLPERAVLAAWDLLTSVRFAVLQIVLLSVAATIGIVVRQLPGFAFRSAAAYETQMGLLHERYDPVLGAGTVDLLEALGVFQVFSSGWFSFLLVLLLVSIVACTLDRTPRLWRTVSDIRVRQPDPFFDPRLPDRAIVRDGVAVETLRGIMRRHQFRVREAEADGVRFLYGDRHQYTKLATLLTHLGLVLFLSAAAITSRFGFEAPMVIPGGEAQPVLPVGTPGNLVVKNLGFEAPRNPDGGFADFRTDLAVYRDGEEIARKTIRVNDPLSVAGFTFHQNFFGPTADLELRDLRGGLLWSGPIPLDEPLGGQPHRRFVVPGRDLWLELLLDRDPAGAAVLRVIGLRQVGVEPDGTPTVRTVLLGNIRTGATFQSRDADLSLQLAGIGAYTGLIAKQDPGQGIVWLAFASLLAGLVITFYLPRRRVWARLAPDGEVRAVFRADRYVDVEREFGRLLDDLVAVRARPG